MLTSADSHRTPQVPDDCLRTAPLFRCAPRPTASDAVAWRWRAVHGRARAKRARNIARAGAGIAATFSARFHRKDKDLAGINTIWISDLVPVRFVNDCVSHARAISDTADAPEAVATGYDRGRDLGHYPGGR